jgi:hypothetical protein
LKIDRSKRFYCTILVKSLYPRDMLMYQKDPVRKANQVLIENTLAVASCGRFVRLGVISTIIIIVIKVIVVIDYSQSLTKNGG